MNWGNFKEDSVSEAYKKMKAEELKGNQVELDKNKNGKLDKKDFEMIRNEDYDDETAVDKSKIPAYLRKNDKLTLKDLDKERTKNKSHPETIIKINGTAQKEETEVDAEQIDEVKMADLPSTKVQGRSYGAYKPESDYVKGPSDAQLKKIESEKKKPKNEGLDLFSEREIDTLINEVLSKDAPASDWINDFVNSNNPKFAGKSHAQRKKQALAAYYAAKKNESTDYDSFLDEAVQKGIVNMDAKEIKHANMKDKQDDQEVMEPHSGTEQKFLDAHSVIVTDEPNKSGTPNGADKAKRAVGPKGKGPGSYDAKEKLGKQGIVKEDIVKIGRTATGEEGEVINTDPQTDAKDKKTFRDLKGTTKAAVSLQKAAAGEAQ
jgi:hypothetical protein